MLVRSLIVARDPDMEKRLRRLLADPALELLSSPLAPSSTRASSEQLARLDVDLVVVSEDVLETEGPRYLPSLRARAEAPDLIVIGLREDARRRATLLAEGASAVLFAGLADEDLRRAILALVARRRERSIEAYRSDPALGLESLGSRSEAMRPVLELLPRIAAAESSVLILGETGVGKERVARALHAESRRARGPFVPVNCAALPEGLVESELFGHEAGAFTGAARARKGHFELAHMGTLFLDEIGDVPLSVQAKLLRVLEDRRVQRLGGQKPVPVDVRFIAATHRDLEGLVASGTFRADLYYRLAVLSIRVPPLRERLEDLPELAARILSECAPAGGRLPLGLAADALALLASYSWPGNVRELRNLIERALLLSNGDLLRAEDFPDLLAERARAEGALPPASLSGPRGIELALETALSLPLKEARRRVDEVFERAYVENVLRECGGRIGLAAHRAGINARTLYDLMRRHGLDKKHFRRSAG